MGLKNFGRCQRGAATVYLLISFTALIIAVGVLTDLARIRLAQYQLKKSVNSAARSVMADYDPGLRQAFGLFVRDEAGAAQDFDRYLKSTLNMYREDFILSVHYDNSAVKMSRSLEQRETLKNQILEDMKYKGPVDFFSKLFDYFKQIAGVKNFFQNSHEMKKSLVRINSYLEELHENHKLIQEYLESLVQNRKRIKILQQQLERGNGQSTASIEAEISELRQRCHKAENQIDMALQRAERLTIELELEIQKLETKFTAVRREQGEGDSLGKPVMRELAEQQAAVHQNLGQAIEQYKKDLRDISTQLEISREKFKKLRDDRDSLDVAGIGLEAASTAWERINQNNGKEMPEEDKDLLLKEAASLSQLYEELGEEVEAVKKAKTENGDDHEGDRISEVFDDVSNKLDENRNIYDLRDELYIDQYVLSRFSNLTTGAAGDEKHPFRSHEAEYICYGRDGKMMALGQLYFMRTALDTATYFAFSKAPAELIQRMLYSLTMGALHAVVDVYKLVGQKETVPIGSMMGQNPLREMTLSYTDHLRILFLLRQDEAGKLSRIAEIMAMRNDIEPGQLFSNMEGEATASIKLWFMPALGFGNMERGPFGTSIKDGVCYINKKVGYGYYEPK